VELYSGRNPKSILRLFQTLCFTFWGAFCCEESACHLLVRSVEVVSCHDQDEDCSAYIQLNLLLSNMLDAISRPYDPCVYFTINYMRISQLWC
jgi:hypothetical protein